MSYLLKMRGAVLQGYALSPVDSIAFTAPQSSNWAKFDPVLCSTFAQLFTDEGCEQESHVRSLVEVLCRTPQPACASLDGDTGTERAKVSPGFGSYSRWI
jgi:hypothetical protein